MKSDEKVSIDLYHGRNILQFGANQRGRYIGSAAPSLIYYFAWPNRCPCCGSKKLGKEFWFSDEGDLLLRSCDRCDIIFGIPGKDLSRSQ